MTHTYAAGNAVIDTLDKRRAFPMSGDATARHRSEHVEPRHAVVNLWRSRKVIPSRKTYGIEVGSRIRTYFGIIRVTRVGTIAGFGIVEPNGTEERRWEAWQVIEVLQPEVADRIKV